MQYLNAQIKARDKKGWWDFDKAKDRTARPEVEYIPGNGSHLFTYKEGSQMYMIQSSEKALSIGFDNKPTKYEKIYIGYKG